MQCSRPPSTKFQSAKSRVFDSYMTQKERAGKMDFGFQSAKSRVFDSYLTFSTSFADSTRFQSAKSRVFDSYCARFAPLSASRLDPLGR